MQGTVQVGSIPTARTYLTGETMTTTMTVQQETGYQLIATDQEQLGVAHAQMLAWVQGKQVECATELAEETEAFAVAKAHKWATAKLRRRITQLEQRQVFYAKIEEAVQAGYVIVPNFDMNVFAIRTTATDPVGVSMTWQHGRPVYPQQAELLPVGEGEYQSPNVDVGHSPEMVTKPDGTAQKTTRYWPSTFKDVEFPIALAKPMLMSRTAEVMAKKLFDEIGVAVDTRVSRRAGDPILLGVLRNPRRTRPDITFFIGWYFSPDRL